MRDLAQVARGRAHGSADHERTRFCTYCGSLFDVPASAPARPLRGRVCASCGLGMVLTCASELLSRPGAAFLVVTSDLRVSAASQAAEELLDQEGKGLYGRPLLSVLTSPAGVAELARRVVRAAIGQRGVQTVAVEPAATKLPGVSLTARIGTCSTPPAALVVVETGG